MKVAIAISSVLGLYIAAPANAHVLQSGANGAISTSLPSARSDDRGHDGVCEGPVNRNTEKREVEKLALQGAGAGGKLSHVSSIAMKAGRVLGEMDAIGPDRPDADGGEGPERGERSDARGSSSRASSSPSSDLAVTRQGSEVLDAGDAITGSVSEAVGRDARSGPIDLGPDLAGAAKYGEGFAGALGVPEFSYLGELAPGAAIQLFVENSSGVECFGYLRVGHRQTHVVLRSGAVLLCSADILIARVKLFPGTNQVQYTIPHDAVGAIYMQVTQQDEAALGGWSMSKGLKLIL